MVGQTAVFSGAAGSVAVVGPVAFNSLRFETNGYVVFAGSGGVLTTNTPDSVVLLAPAVTTTIGVPIAGSGGLDVQGAGTLILTSDDPTRGRVRCRGMERCSSTAVGPSSAASSTMAP